MQDTDSPAVGVQDTDSPAVGVQDTDSPAVGIGITTHNRGAVLRTALEAVRKYAPTGAVIVVVDDASDEPVEEATFRFDTNAGIARAKNKCLELLIEQGCEQLFLFDDDCWPVVDGWERPYLESPEPHLMYMFVDTPMGRLPDSTEIYRDEQHKAYTHPRGCMLYFDRRVLDRVGGYDTRYGRWGYEHLDLSNRIHNAGLTSFRFADVTGSEGLIFSCDQRRIVGSTVPDLERFHLVRDLKTRSEASYRSVEYREFRTRAVGEAATTGVVLTTYLTAQPDPQRGTAWTPAYQQLDELRRSVERHGRQLVILHDCLDVADTELVTHVRVPAGGKGASPYFHRWLCYWRYLREHPEVEQVWCVDGTDVEMLRDPFPEMGDRLYVGDEQQPLCIPWMIYQHGGSTTLLEFLSANRGDQLLNAGIAGGRRETVLEFCRDLFQFCVTNAREAGPVDMGPFNYVARTWYAGMIVHGRQVNTVFQKYDSTSTESWWRHK
ncbi:glycosyltransferase family 2 protein [Micromonospora sp. RTGN7]|uniref:glycosyltransferase family 2 protein n=1 Tax=Micromonospora sp. RTGN7 TaxID=3016526 RepID=UPI0029FED7A7|nr:galactosyltransferase-related protein [Micromonospora sp. RTGN7]